VVASTDVTIRLLPALVYVEIAAAVRPVKSEPSPMNDPVNDPENGDVRSSN
jgi:hypothetical protein